MKYKYIIFCFFVILFISCDINHIYNDKYCPVTGFYFLDENNIIHKDFKCEHLSGRVYLLNDICDTCESCDFCKYYNPSILYDN